MSLSKESLDVLYRDRGLSMAQIAEELGCSASKVVYWMDKHGIERRSISEAVYQYRNPNGDPFTIRVPESVDEYALFYLSLGLYIGEGKKRDREQISLSNSDSRVIRIFLRFLREICGVEEQRIWAWINLFDDADLKASEEFWMSVTGLAIEQFHKPVIRAQRVGTYLSRSKYGALSVGVSSTKLHTIVMQWCNAHLLALWIICPHSSAGRALSW